MNKLKSRHNYDIAIIGGGAVGLSLALALQTSGLNICGIGFVAPQIDDGRSAALMNPSLKLLETYGISLHGAALSGIRMIDMTGKSISAKPLLFRADEIGEAQFGLNISNFELLKTLHQHIEKAENIALTPAFLERFSINDTGADITLSNGEEIHACLMIAADGQNSPTRAAAGIEISQHDYAQVALTFLVKHPRDHEDISTEFQTLEGPLTFVPAAIDQGNASSVVWVMKETSAALMLQRPPDDIIRSAEQFTQGFLGKLTLQGRIGRVPLRFITAKRYYSQRLALIGEAAHAFPPIGAQGLNTSFRDIACLSELIQAAIQRGDDIAAPSLLETYEHARRSDALIRGKSIDMLNRSLMSDFLPNHLLRSTGMSLLTHAPAFLRRAIMKAGIGGAKIQS